MSFVATVTDTFRASLEEHLADLARAIAAETDVDVDVIAKIIQDFSGGKSRSSAPRRASTKPQSTEVVVMIDYSDKCAAVFGDTKSIKDTLLKAKCKYCVKLAFGAGWIIPSSRLALLEKELKSAKIVYRRVERYEYENEIEGGGENGVEDEEGDAPPPDLRALKAAAAKAKPVVAVATPAAKPSTSAKPSTPASAKAVAKAKPATPAKAAAKSSSTDKPTRNRFGNFEDAKTGLVFAKNPKTKKAWAIGIQETDGSIGPIPAELVTVCENHEPVWDYDATKVAQETFSGEEDGSEDGDVLDDEVSAEGGEIEDSEFEEDDD